MIDAMKQALEWANEHGETVFFGGGIDAVNKMNEWTAALRQAIEQAEKQQALDKKADNARELGLDYEPEPVAWMEDSIEFYAKDHPTNSCTIPLYTSPPRKEWVGLTDEEIDQMWRVVAYTKPYDQFRMDIGRAIEAKLKEKNT